MKNNKDLIKHVCNEELVSAFIDNRMNENEKKDYLKKIEDCLKIRECVHCKELIIDFLSIKRNCFSLQSDYKMPKTLEKDLLGRIRSALLQTKVKQQDL